MRNSHRVQNRTKLTVVKKTQTYVELRTGATCPPELIAQSKFRSEVPILPFLSVTATSSGCWNRRPHRPFAHDVASPLTRYNIGIYFFAGAFRNLLLSPLERSIGLSLRWAATSWGLPAITHSGRACRKRQHLFLVLLGSGFGDLCMSEWESHDSRLFSAVCIHRTPHTILISLSSCATLLQFNFLQTSSYASRAKVLP